MGVIMPRHELPLSGSAWLIWLILQLPPRFDISYIIPFQNSFHISSKALESLASKVEPSSSFAPKFVL